MEFLRWIIQICVILCILLAKYMWRRRRIYQLSWSLPGPFALPLLGNALIFLCKDEDIFERAVEVVGRYPSPLRFWFGPKFTILFTDAAQAEKIVSSMKFTQKDEVYRFIQDFNGEGLISGSGPKWKRDRRLMSPLFLKRNIMQYFPNILEHTKLLVDILEQEVDKSTINIEHYIHRAATDFVNETVLGTSSDAQHGELDSFLEHAARAYELVHRRIIKVWLQVDFIYRFTPSYREQAKAKKITHGFFWKALEEAKKNHTHLGTNKQSFRSVLDVMLDIRDEVPDYATDQEIVHHLSTLYTASEDTVTVIAAFALVALGIHPEYQELVAKEIFTVIGNERNIEEEDLSKLEYLEMVIKETLRYFPIAPFLMREAGEDFQVDQWLIPKGTSVIVAIHNIHRSEKYWERPNEFYPEHFSREAVSKRHPYAYMPFSAGPRACLGKPYAFVALKIILTSILQRYVVESDGPLHEKPLTTDISVRFKDKNYPVRLKRRLFE